jgi:hypothetical protein
MQTENQNRSRSAPNKEAERNEARADASLFLQDLDYIKTMIEKGASAHDVLLFLDTPRCDDPEVNAGEQPRC